MRNHWTCCERDGNRKNQLFSEMLYLPFAVYSLYTSILSDAEYLIKIVKGLGKDDRNCRIIAYMYCFEYFGTDK